MTRKSIFAAVALGALTALSGFALSAQEPDAADSPEGAWLVKGTFGPGSNFIWFDTYTSDSTNRARAGAVLCTLPNATATESGHGVWARIEKHKFAFTAWRIQVSPNRPPVQPVGLAKYWGAVTLTSNNTMTGTLNAEFYDLDGNLVGRMLGGTSSGTRIQIQYE